jgi:hypothetical protein
LARARSSRACSSLYFGVGVGEASLITRVLLLALALAFVFDSVLLQAPNARADNTSAAGSHKFFVIPYSFTRKGESPASPLAGDSLSEIFHGFADLPFGFAELFLYVAFDLIGGSPVAKVAVTSQLTQFLFDRALNLFAFAL